MKSLTKFLRRISSRLLLSPKRLEAIEALDASRIYVENVRSLFGISTGLAKRLCELAVRQGFLEKRIQVLCPDQAVLSASALCLVLSPCMLPGASAPPHSSGRTWSTWKTSGSDSALRCGVRLMPWRAGRWTRGSKSTTKLASALRFVPFMVPFQSISCVPTAHPDSTLLV
jgi:hypothetical protein